MPLLGGLIAAAAAGALGRAVVPAAAAPAALAVGLTSPVLFFSQLFWEHTPVAALCLIAVVVLARSSGPTGLRLVAAAAALFLAVALRPESLLLVAVLPLALALMVERRPRSRTRSRRVRWALPVGALIFAVAIFGLWPEVWMVVSGWLQEMLAAGRSLLAFVVRASSLLTPFPARLAEAWFDLGVELGPAVPSALAWIGTVGALVALAAVALREPYRGWAVAAGGSLVLVPSWWVLCSAEPYRAVHALILPAPYLVLVAPILRPPSNVHRRPAVFLGLTTTMYLFLGTALAMTKMVGGLEWGNRYLLPLITLGAVVAAIGAVIYAIRDRGRRPRLAVVSVVVVCLVTGGLYQLRGARELLISKRALEACRREVIDADVPVVTDLYWMPAALAVAFAERPIFTLGDRDALGGWVGRIGNRGNRFRLITGDNGKDEIRRWIESVPAPSLRLLGTRSIPGVLIADIDAAVAVDGGGK
jgi:hypothetical protein